MSIEKDIERIAQSLENISNCLTELAGQKRDAENNGREGAPIEHVPGPGAAAEDTIPGLDESPAIQTNEDVRELVQKLLVEAEKKKMTSKLVTFIRDEVCGKLSPEKPKLMDLPAKVLPKAVKMISDFAVKNGLNG